MSEKELLTDNRGWKKGRLRTHNCEERKRIIAIRKQLKKEESYFIGAKVVAANYKKLYGAVVKKWFVDSVLKEADLVAQKKGKTKGRSRYMQYPVQTISKLGKILMGIDFIGPKYLEKSPKRINFVSCKYIRPIQWGITKRIEGQTTEETIQALMKIWEDHPT